MVACPSLQCGWSFGRTSYLSHAIVRLSSFIPAPHSCPLYFERSLLLLSQVSCRAEQYTIIHQVATPGCNWLSLLHKPRHGVLLLSFFLPVKAGQTRSRSSVRKGAGAWVAHDGGGAADRESARLSPSGAPAAAKLEVLWLLRCTRACSCLRLPNLFCGSVPCSPQWQRSGSSPIGAGRAPKSSAQLSSAESGES